VEVHVPVLVAEVRDLLAPRPGARFLDGTVGAGGHAAALAPLLAPGGLYIGIDRDPDILEIARARLAPLGALVRLRAGRFGDLAEIAREEAPGGLDAIFLDVGVSSLQLDRPERGFSFAVEGPLDMRMDRAGGITAADLVNRLPEAELADLIYRYGEERLSRRIARAIVEERRRARIETTSHLARVVERAVPGRYEGGRIHPATRTFQALRIAVNGELSELERALAAAPGALAPGGRIAVISFHSLEDRIVKNAFRHAAKAGRLEVLTKKPLVATEDEVRGNRRARSAKLRAARRPRAGGEPGRGPEGAAEERR
jgi:16S rRNA (cytosine1402-N4)-methyltransferase